MDDLATMNEYNDCMRKAAIIMRQMPRTTRLIHLAEVWLLKAYRVVQTRLPNTAQQVQYIDRAKQHLCNLFGATYVMPSDVDGHIDYLTYYNRIEDHLYRGQSFFERNLVMDAEVQFLKAFQLRELLPIGNDDEDATCPDILFRIRECLEQLRDPYILPKDVQKEIDRLERLIRGGFYPFDVGCPLSKHTVQELPDTLWMPEPNSNGFVPFRTNQVYSHKLQGHDRCLEEALTFAWGSGLGHMGVKAGGMMKTAVALRPSPRASSGVQGTIKCVKRMLEALPKSATGHHFSFEGVALSKEHVWLRLIVPIPYLLLVCCPVQWWDNGAPQVTTHWCVLDTARLLLFVAPKTSCLPEAKREWVQGCVQIELKDLTKHGASFSKYILEKYKLMAPTVAYKLMVNVHHVHDHDTGFVYSPDVLANSEHMKTRMENETAKKRRHQQSQHGNQKQNRFLARERKRSKKETMPADTATTGTPAAQERTPDRYECEVEITLVEGLGHTSSKYVGVQWDADAEVVKAAVGRKLGIRASKVQLSLNRDRSNPFQRGPLNEYIRMNTRRITLYVHSREACREKLRNEVEITLVEGNSWEACREKYRKPKKRRKGGIAKGKYRSEVPCRDFAAGKCRWADTCRLTHET